MSITNNEWERFINNECSLEEAERILKFLTEGGSYHLQKEWTKKQLSQQPNDNTKANEATLRTGWQNIEAGIYKKQEHSVKRLPTVWLSIAAACIGLLLTATYIFLQQCDRGERKTVAVAIKNDVLPGGNKATLTLASGGIIVLDNANNGTVAQQGGTTIMKLKNGQLAYNTTDEKPLGVLYNTLVTPAGGQYNIVLPDGSKVWLNASSSLRFPAAFVGTDRVVELTGEAYFEVVKNAAMPFHVRVNNMDVRVLGTHFNISAYNDEAAIKTTLLEGSVKVTHGIASSTLKPGEQAQLNKQGVIIIEKNADTEQAVAWKNGNFKFNMDDIESIMRQLQRWYNIEVAYEGKKPEGHYMGTISRNNNISVVLQMFEQSGLHFKVAGKKLTVLQ